MNQNGVKMNILWPKETQWHFCKYQKTYSRPKPIGFTFYKLKSVFFESVKDGGLNFASSRGSLAKTSAEGVRANLSRWIAFQRPWLDPRGEREVAGRLQGQRGGAIAGASPELGEKVIWCTIQWNKSTGTKRKETRTHPNTFCVRGWLGEVRRWRRRLVAPCTSSRGESVRTQ